MKRPPWITLAAIAYGAWAVKGMAIVWWYSPLDHFSWIPLLIWLIPALRWTATLSEGQTRGIAAALTIIVLGFMASMNSIKQFGLAVAVASLVPWSYHSLLWVATSISWMPAFGWVIAHLLPNASSRSMLVIRILLALTGFFVMWRKRNE